MRAGKANVVNDVASVGSSVPNVANVADDVASFGGSV